MLLFVGNRPCRQLEGIGAGAGDLEVYGALRGLRERSGSLNPGGARDNDMTR